MDQSAPNLGFLSVVNRWSSSQSLVQIGNESKKNTQLTWHANMNEQYCFYEIYSMHNFFKIKEYSSHEVIQYPATVNIPSTNQRPSLKKCSVTQIQKVSNTKLLVVLSKHENHHKSQLTSKIVYQISSRKNLPRQTICADRKR